MTDKTYPMSFGEALDALAGGLGWIRGEDFEQGLYLTLNTSGQVIAQKANRCGGNFEPFLITLHEGLMSQRYRLFQSLEYAYD